MKYLRFILIGLTVSLMWGCATSSPVVGAVNKTTHSGLGSIGIVSNNVKAVKEGRSECTSILGVYAYGDCSVEAAKTNGGIKKVSSVSHETDSIMFFYDNYTTVVKGE